ncbi:PTS sugar transporter subunit IIA [Bacillota bacterium Lsc_1132]
MEILDLIQPDLIFTQLEVKSKNELFKVLSGQLIKKGYVKESFLSGLLDREKTYPTGLELKNFGCALPHTDKEHVIKPVITVALLKNPVVFKNMENPKNEVNVNLVFMLALNNSEHQIEALRQLAALIQNDSFYEKVSKIKSGDEILTIIKGFDRVGI